MRERPDHFKTHGLEIDPSTANSQRRIVGTEDFYYQNHDTPKWTPGTVYWQGFPPSDSFTLGPSSHIPSDASPPTGATTFTMGGWNDVGNTLDYTVGQAGVTQIFKLEGMKDGKPKGSGYLVVQTPSSPKREETSNLLWFTLGTTDAPPSIITSLKATVTFSSLSEVKEAAPSGEQWWQSTDTGG